MRKLAKVHPTAALKNISAALNQEAEAQRKIVHARLFIVVHFFTQPIYEKKKYRWEIFGIFVI